MLTPATEPEVVVRPGEEGDLAFVRSSWLRSQRKEGNNYLLSDQRFDREHKRIFREFLPLARFTVVCPVDYPRLIYSYSLSYQTETFPILFWAFTREGYRKQGFLARQINFLNEPFFYCFTSSFSNILRKKYKGAVYDPFILRDLFENKIR